MPSLPTGRMSDGGKEKGGVEATGFSHVPVMLREVISGLEIDPHGIYVDGTAGGGGHSEAIASKLEDGRLIAIDRDPDAVNAASARLSRFGDRVTVVKSNFTRIREVLSDLGIDKINGFLLDLGVSSYQLDTPERGFSYMHDAPLSMKMDDDGGADAFFVVNNYGKDELADVLYRWGEEQFARRIAEGIVEARRKKPVETTFELVDIVKRSLPDAGRDRRHHPAMKTFQAIRIEVNREIEIIPPTLTEAVGLLVPGGRGCVITFHSIEDRTVKETFAGLARGCTCPRDFPVCVCGKKPSIRLRPAKALTPSEEELKTNPRSHSAKLRIIEKI